MKSGGKAAESPDRGRVVSQMDNMFMGEHHHSLDAKGRLIMPSEFRQLLGEKFYMTKGTDKCLFVYSQEGWKAFEEGINSLPDITNSAGRMFRRYFYGSCETCEPDKQGRVYVPAPLRDYAGLCKEIILVGTGPRIEIWSPQEWEKYQESVSFDMMEAAAREAGWSMF